MTNSAQRLKQSGLKATFQRISILDAISQKGHLCVDEIYEAICKRYPNISLATIYKNILQMIKSDLLVEVPILGSKPKYETLKDSHMHLICTECKTVLDIPRLPNIQEEIVLSAKREDFDLSKELINLYGVCSKCRKRKG